MMRAILLAFLLVSNDDTGRYPRDISPPPGTRYPCALTALPAGLPGIAGADRDYVNRTYARILRATQAKLLVLKALEERRDINAAANRYDAAVTKLLSALKADTPPSGLQNFHRDVILAMELQQRFFRKAAPMRAAGKSMEDVYRLPEGGEASSRLIAAWNAMVARYPSWPEKTKDSVYHHLCALDLF